MSNRFDVKVKGNQPTQAQIASYLIKTFLGLRDRENENRAVRLLGSGSAIPIVLLVTEIIRTRMSGVSSIVEFETINKTLQGDYGESEDINIVAIRVNLTLNPTEQEKNMPGYQASTNLNDDKYIDLFDYVMLYAKDLYSLKMGNRQQTRPYSSNRDQQGLRNNNREQYNNQNREQYSNQQQHHSVQQVRSRQFDADKSNDWRVDRENTYNQQLKQSEQSEQDRSNIKTRGGYGRQQYNNQDRRQAQVQRDNSRSPVQQQRNRNVRPRFEQRQYQQQQPTQQPTEQVQNRGQVRTRGGIAK